jgi:hypothetical protein
MSDTVQVPLSGIRGFGKRAIVDACDAHLVSGRSWSANAYGYARRGDHGHDVLMHREIAIHRIGAPPSPKAEVDHINGDKLDNRAANLRWATKLENSKNVRRHADNSSGYKGIWLHRPNGKWAARIEVDRKAVNLGYFESPEDAAAAYDGAARHLHGEFASLNFPDQVHPPPASITNPRAKSSRFIGVTWSKKQSKWCAQIAVAGGRVRHLGSFAEEVEAARAYNAAATSIKGAAARLNAI